MSYRQATAVEVIEIADGRARHRGEIPEGWNIRGNANGGHSMLLMGRACLALCPQHPHPLSTTARYFLPVHTGEVEIESQVMHSTRSVSHLQVELWQDGKLAVIAQVTATDLLFGKHSEIQELQPISLPPPAACVPPRIGVGTSFHDNLGVVITPDSLENLAQGNGPPARLDGWFSATPRDQNQADKPAETMDCLAPLLLCDAAPPAPFVWSANKAWVPTLEMTVHLRRAVDIDVCQFSSVSRFNIAGYAEEDVHLWDGQNLIAMSRQIMKMPRPN